MKLLVLYRPDSEHATMTESFLRELKRRTGNEDNIEVKSVDTRDGAATASIYDVMQYPGILVLDNFGSVVRSWQGDRLPLIDDVSGYMRS